MIVQIKGEIIVEKYFVIKLGFVIAAVAMLLMINDYNRNEYETNIQREHIKIIKHVNQGLIKLDGEL